MLGLGDAAATMTINGEFPGLDGDGEERPTSRPLMDWGVAKHIALLLFDLAVYSWWFAPAASCVCGSAPVASVACAKGFFQNFLLPFAAHISLNFSAHSAFLWCGLANFWRSVGVSKVRLWLQEAERDAVKRERELLHKGLLWKQQAKRKRNKIDLLKKSKEVAGGGEEERTWNNGALLLRELLVPRDGGQRLVLSGASRSPSSCSPCDDGDGRGLGMGRGGGEGGGGTSQLDLLQKMRLHAAGAPSDPNELSARVDSLRRDLASCRALEDSDNLPELDGLEEASRDAVAAARQVNTIRRRVVSDVLLKKARRGMFSHPDFEALYEPFSSSSAAPASAAPSSAEGTSVLTKIADSLGLLTSLEEEWGESVTTIAKMRVVLGDDTVDSGPLRMLAMSRDERCDK